MRPVERVVYRSGALEVGAFRCPPEHPDFARAGQIRDHCAFVFPRTAVRICHEGRPAFTADPAVVTFYNPGQPYTRAAVDSCGDRCEWFAVDTDTAAEAVRAHDPRSAECERAPFRFTHGPSDARSYLVQRRLFEALVRGAAVDALAVEEAVILLLEDVLRQAYAAWRGGLAPPCPPLTTREAEAARHARELLAARYREPLSLADLASLVGLSRFRLCRAFRRATGTTLHALRDQLRLRAALEALGAGCSDLTGLALELGYSSHSHFSQRFRAVFGRPPSRIRAGFLTD